MPRKAVTDTPELTIRQITKHSGNREWQTYLVQGWQEGGKWQRKQFKDEDDAKRFVALKTVELLNKERAMTNVMTRLSHKQLVAAEHAVERLGDYTINDAVEFFLKHHVPSTRKLPVEVALREYVGQKEKSVRPATIQQINAVGRELLRSFSGVMLDAITTPDLIKHLEGLRARGGVAQASLKTRANHRAVLGAFFSWAERERYVTANPIKDVPRTSAKRLRQGIPDTLSIEEARSLMSFVENYKGGVMIRYFALCLFAGIRPGLEDSEIIRIDENDIDLKTGVIRIRPEVSKTHQLRVVEIQPNLRRWLEESPRQIRPVNFGSMVAKIRQECGLSGRSDILRHSWFTFHVARWRSVGEAALQGGNTEAIIKAHYLDPRRVTLDDAKEFWSILPGAGENKITRIA